MLKSNLEAELMQLKEDLLIVEMELKRIRNIAYGLSKQEEVYTSKKDYITHKIQELEEELNNE